MFETIALGRVAAEREESRRAGPVGDEDVMIICLPRRAGGVIGEIVGHLNQLSQWHQDGDRDLWDSPWHEADHGRSYNDYFGHADRDLWIDGPSAHLTDDFAGDLQMGSGRRVPGLPPGLFCCSPDIGYDLWHGTYAREPALWGKYSFRPLPGDAGPQEWGAGAAVRRDGHTFATKTAIKRERRAAQAEKVAARFARVAAQFADGLVELDGANVTIPLVVGESTSTAYDNIAAAAKNAASREGLYWTASRIGPHAIWVQFSADPTAQLAGYDDDGLAAVAVLLGALDGSIDCGSVIPLGDGQFGVTGLGVGNIFKKIGEAFKKKDKPDKLKKKLEKLWAKFEKLNSQLEEAGGDRYEPWAKAAATAAAVGEMVEVGRGGRRRAKRMMRQMQQQRQQQEAAPPPPTSSSSSSTTNALLQQILAAQQQAQTAPPMGGGRGGGGRRRQQQQTAAPTVPMAQVQTPYTPIPIPQVRPPVASFAPPAYGSYPGYGYQGHMPLITPVMGIWEDGGNAWSEGHASLHAERWG